ncbi:MAG: deaminase [Spirochaetales bacterium]|jgi:dCMP deaminase|nr:deaminase [Spirochaetales bacterium]
MREIDNPGKWWKRFLNLSIHVSIWSKDPSTKVGAVITQGNLVQSIGFNGPPRGVSDNEVTREIRLLTTIHSEVNAVLTAKQDLTGASLFCTHPSCANCAAVIIQSGIVRVVCIKPETEFEGRWLESSRQAEILFKEAGVEYFCVDPEYLI